MRTKGLAAWLPRVIAGVATIWCASAVASCSGSSPAQTAPTTPVGSVAPAIVCPVDLDLMEQGGVMPAGNYAATPEGGAPPVSTNCTPTSGSQFPVGATVVTCTETDALARKASCTFDVVVTSPPHLSATSFLAFGDSVTEGKVATGARGPFLEFPDTSYTQKLRDLLTARYTDQATTVDNSGFGGENAAEVDDGRSAGIDRLPTVLASTTDQVLLLLEGANDLSDPGVNLADVSSALRQMVDDGHAHGMTVMLATLPPEASPRDDASIANVPLLNAQIASVAASAGATLVDVYGAFPADTTGLLGADGLHLTASGYGLVANAFFAAIKSTLEISPTPAARATSGPYGACALTPRACALSVLKSNADLEGPRWADGKRLPEARRRTDRDTRPRQRRRSASEYSRDS